jgi:hypothetical protein
MPNAWFYYVLPITISIAFIIAGLILFRQFARGDRDTKGNKYGPGNGCAGVLFIVVGGTLGLAILLTSPTPWRRQSIFDHIFRTPLDRIERFVIKAGDASQYRPLTQSEVVIDNPARIRQIAEILRAAREVSPNHPRTRWTTRVEMVTHDGTYYFGVDATVSGDSNGTLVGVGSNPSGGGWNLGDVRADGLDKILEDAVNTAAPH